MSLVSWAVIGTTKDLWSTATVRFGPKRRSKNSERLKKGYVCFKKNPGLVVAALTNKYKVTAKPSTRKILATGCTGVLAKVRQGVSTRSVNEQARRQRFGLSKQLPNHQSSFAEEAMLASPELIETRSFFHIARGFIKKC